jgi:hypothetical protein
MICSSIGPERIRQDHGYRLMQITLEFLHMHTYYLILHYNRVFHDGHGNYF